MADASDASGEPATPPPSCSCPQPEVRIPWQFPQPNRGSYNLDQSIELVSDGGSMSFHHEIRFYDDITRGIALGIDTDAPLPAGGRGKGAYFSIWGATASRGSCRVEDPLEAVTTCRVAYDFLPSHVYTLRIWRLEDVDKQWWYWGAWIVDVSNPKEETLIGELRGPYLKDLLGTSESVVRYRARGDTCSEEPKLHVRLAAPRLDGDTLRATAPKNIAASSCSLAKAREDDGKVEVVLGRE